MIDNKALAHKLAALAADDEVYANGARVISQGGKPSAVTAILNEIDDTVLERKLVFSIGGVNVAMVVGGRRLQGLVEIGSDVAGKDAVIDKVLSSDDTDLLTAVGAIMTEVCEDDPKVTVRSAGSARLGSGAEVGVSIKTLTPYWESEAEEPTGPPMQRFLAKSGAAITASLYITDNTVSATTGAGADVGILQKIWDDQATPFEKSHRALQPKASGPKLVCLDNAVGGSKSAAIARADGEASVFVYDPAQIGKILKSWRAITR